MSTPFPASRFLVPLPVPPTAQRTPSPTALAHAVLAEREEWVFAQDGVGLYQANAKIPTHQVLSVQITTHRLLFICPTPESTTTPPIHLQLHLADIRQTEHYTGFLRSSPKITLQLGIPSNNDSVHAERSPRPPKQHTGEWKCPVCGFQNPPAPASGNAHWSTAVPGTTKCNLCGIPRPEDLPEPAVAQAACSRCTYLNTPGATACEMCGAPLPGQAETQTQTEIVRISFRRGGDKEVYRRLKAVLGSRTWERRPSPSQPGSRTGTPSRGIGIDGILAGIELEQQTKTGEVRDAFGDLEALMVRAGEMVKVVQSLNAKLSTSTVHGPPEAEAETRTFLRSSLVQLGLPVPAITQDATTSKDEREYLDALAAELGGLLVGSGGAGLMGWRDGKGLVGMDEAWVIWNRARGVSLISPQVMQKVVPLLAAHTHPTPVEKLRFLSGLEVLHTPVYSPRTFAARVRRRLDDAVPADPTSSHVEAEPYTTTLDIALTEGLAVALTKEMVAFVAMIPDCGLVRDDQGAGSAGGGALVGGPVGERWYRDLIAAFTWVDVNE